MSDTVDRLIQDALIGATEAEVALGRTELQFEVWFNYFQERVGERNLFNKVQVFDDLSFNTDGYQPTVFPVVNQLLEGMTSIGMDFIKPSKIGITIDPDDAETFGDLIAEDLEGLYWILFTVIEPKHPLKGVRYATAYRNGELVYPPTDPSFTDSYPDERVHEMARGIFIDISERFIKLVRPDIFKTDEHGKLLP